MYHGFIYYHLLHCQFLPFITNFLNGNKWMFISIYYLGQLVDGYISVF